MSKEILLERRWYFMWDLISPWFSLYFVRVNKLLFIGLLIHACIHVYYVSTWTVSGGHTENIILMSSKNISDRTLFPTYERTWFQVATIGDMITHLSVVYHISEFLIRSYLIDLKAQLKLKLI